MWIIVFSECEENVSEMKKGSGRGACGASRHKEMSEHDNYMEPFIGKKMEAKEP